MVFESFKRLLYTVSLIHSYCPKGALVMNINNSESNEKKRRIFLWICCESSETRGRRKVHDNGCDWWNIKSTSKPLPQQMTPCEKCTNRPRKDEGGIYEQISLLEAKREQERRNNGWVRK